MKMILKLSVLAFCLSTLACGQQSQLDNSTDLQSKGSVNAIAIIGVEPTEDDGNGCGTVTVNHGSKQFPDCWDILNSCTGSMIDQFGKCF